MDNKKTERIFVYGTLMTGFHNYKKYLTDVTLKKEEGYIKGSLYHIENKGYPAFIEEGKNKIAGEILTINNEKNIVKLLDELESYEGSISLANEYNKKSEIIYDKKGCVVDELYVYVYNPHSPLNKDDRLIPVESGSWREYMKKK